MKKMHSIGPILPRGSLGAALAILIWSGTSTILAESKTAAADLDTAPSVATVNGEPVYADAVEHQLRRTHGSADAGDRSDWDPERLLFKVVNDVLLGQEARALGMDQEAPIPEKIDEYRREAAVRRLEFEEITKKARPTEKEVKALFEREYRQVTFRVLTAYEREEAMELRSALEQGAEPEELAREKSVDPYRMRGGLVDNVDRIDLQRGIGELVFALEPGELGGPVRTDLGWSVVRVEKRNLADPKRRAGLEPKLRAVVRQEKTRAARKVLASELQTRHTVEIEREAVAEITPGRRTDGRLIPTVPDPDRMVVRVSDDQVITAKEYGKALLDRWTGVRNEEAARATAPIVLDRLIEAKLILAEAIFRGYLRTPEVDRAAHAFETTLLVPLFLEEIVAADIEISEAQKVEYYEKNRNSFRRPPKLRLGQITVESREEALQVAASLREGADLAWLVEQHSTDRYKERGGDRGWYTPSPSLTDFNAALLTAQVGEVLEPFGAEGNWVVLMVVGREEQGIYDLSEVSGNVRDALFQVSFRSKLDEFIKTLRSRSEIEIHEEVLMNLRITGSQEAPSKDAGGHEHGP